MVQIARDLHLLRGLGHVKVLQHHDAALIGLVLAQLFALLGRRPDGKGRPRRQVVKAHTRAVVHNHGAASLSRKCEKFGILRKVQNCIHCFS